MSITYMTEDGYNKLKDEITHLESVERPKISQQIGEARDKGDLSENAEYDAAKDEQAEVEARISQIEHMLKYAKVVEDDSSDVVTVGKKVTLRFSGESAGAYALPARAQLQVRGTTYPPYWLPPAS